MSEIPGIDPSNMPDFESAVAAHKLAHAKLHVNDAKHFTGHLLDTMIFHENPNSTKEHFDKLCDKAQTRLNEFNDHVDPLGGHMHYNDEQQSYHCVSCGDILSFPTLLHRQGLLEANE